MKLVEILALNDWTKVSLSKVNVWNPYGICSCSCLCWKWELKQDHICRPTGGRWEPAAGGETTCLPVGVAEGGNHPCHRFYSRQADRQRQRGATTPHCIAQTIRVNLKLHQETDHTLPGSLKEHTGAHSILPPWVPTAMAKDKGKTEWRGELIPEATSEMVSGALLWSLTEAVEYPHIVLEG